MKHFVVLCWGSAEASRLEANITTHLWKVFILEDQEVFDKEEQIAADIKIISLCLGPISCTLVRAKRVVHVYIVGGNKVFIDTKAWNHLGVNANIARRRIILISPKISKWRFSRVRTTAIFYSNYFIVCLRFR